jgi:hypothetical protein
VAIESEKQRAAQLIPIDFHQDERFLPPIPDSIRRDRRNRGKGHLLQRGERVCRSPRESSREPRTGAVSHFTALTDGNEPRAVAEGWWVRDKEHGLQFKAQVLKAVPPNTSEGVERYLADPGITRAKRLLVVNGQKKLVRTY